MDQRGCSLDHGIDGKTLRYKKAVENFVKINFFIIYEKVFLLFGLKKKFVSFLNNLRFLYKIEISICFGYNSI